MHNLYYVYMLLDPRKFYLPYYVGKGKGFRAMSHLSPTEGGGKNRMKRGVTSRIRRAGFEPKVVFVRTDMNESEAIELEIELIHRFGRRDIKTGILTNMTDGGEGLSGYVFTESHKQNLSNSLKGQVRSTETRALISSNRRGSKASAETKEKMSRTRKGKQTGAENPMFGIPRSEERKQAQSILMTGDGNPMKGRKHSPDAIAKMKAACARRHAKITR